MNKATSKSLDQPANSGPEDHLVQMNAIGNMCESRKDLTKVMPNDSTAQASKNKGTKKIVAIESHHTQSYPTIANQRNVTAPIVSSNKKLGGNPSMTAIRLVATPARLSNCIICIQMATNNANSASAIKQPMTTTSATVSHSKTSAAFFPMYISPATVSTVAATRTIGSLSKLLILRRPVSVLTDT